MGGCTYYDTALSSSDSGEFSEDDVHVSPSSSSDEAGELFGYLATRISNNSQ